MKKIFIILISYLMISTSHADDVSKQVSEYISNIIPGEGLTETSIKLNDKDEDQIKFSILGLRNILEDDNSNLFTQFSLRTKEVNSDGRIHGNLGIGYRKLTDDNSMMYGANTFIDADTFEGHRRLGYGLEAKASLLDLSLNRYQKITNMKTIDGTAEQIISDNVRSLSQDIKKKSADTQSNKYFNIKNLDAKNISLSVLSPTIDIEKNFSLSDMNFKNIGNTDQSNDYKNTLKKVFNDILNKVKEKFSIEDVLENLENFNTNEIENKVKDKFKNKLKKLIN